MSAFKEPVTRPSYYTTSFWMYHGIIATRIQNGWTWYGRKDYAPRMGH